MIKKFTPEEAKEKCPQARLGCAHAEMGTCTLSDVSQFCSLNHQKLIKVSTPDKPKAA